MNTNINPCAPHLAHPGIGAARTAAAIAAADAVDRLLNSMFLAYPPTYLEGVFEREECLDRAELTARELCDYAALAGENPTFFLRDIAQIHCDSPDRDRSIAEALVLLDRISGHRRAA